MCLSAAKEFFADEMPAGKEWKRKAGDGTLLDYYVILLLEISLNTIHWTDAVKHFGDIQM